MTGRSWQVVGVGGDRSALIRGMVEALAEVTGPDGQPAGPIIWRHPSEVIS